MRNWVIVLCTIIFDAILLYVASFFLYWGAWNYFFGSRVGVILAPQMTIFGISILIVGIAFTWMIYSKQKRPSSPKDKGGKNPVA